MTGTNSATLAAVDAIQVDGAVTAPTLGLTSATKIAGAGALSGQAITITGTTPGATIALTGSLNDTGTATITAPGAVALSGTFTGGGALTASSGTSVAVNYGALTASTLALTGTGTGSTVSLGGGATVAGATMLRAPTLITVSGTQQAGTFTAASDTGVSVTGAVSAADITLTGTAGSPSTVTVTGAASLTATNAVTVSAGGAVTLTGPVTAPAIAVTSPVSLVVSGRLSGGTVALRGGSVDLSGPLQATTAAIDAPGGAILNGAIVASGGLTVSTVSTTNPLGASIGGGGALTAASLDLTTGGSNGSVNLTGPISIAGVATILAGSGVTLGAATLPATLTASALTVNAGGSIADYDRGTIGGPLTLTSTGGGIGLYGATTAGVTTLTANTTLDVSAPLTATTLTGAANAGTQVRGLVTATTLSLADPTSIYLTGGAKVAGTASLTSAGTVSLGRLSAGVPGGAVSAATLAITGPAVVELDAPLTATDVVISGIRGVTTVGVDAPVTVAHAFGVTNALSFTNNAAIDPDNITIDVSGPITVNSLLAADRVTLDSGDIVFGRGGSVQAVELAEFLTSSAKATAATVGGTGGAGGYNLDAGELTQVAANRIVVSTGPSSGHSSSSLLGQGTPLDLSVFDLSLTGSATGQGNLFAGPRDPVLAFASFGGVNVRGKVALTSAGTSDTVVLYGSGGPVRVATPTGGIAVTNGQGGLTGEIYAYGPSVVVASDATAAALPGIANLDDRQNLLRTNDGPVAPAGYLQAGRIEIRPTTAFYAENSGTLATYAGLTTGDGGLGIVTGTFDPAAAAAAGGLTGVTKIDTLDGALVRTTPAEVIVYGREVTSGGAIIVNDDFAKLVRTTSVDVTAGSTVNDCLLPGAICTSGAYQGKPTVDAGSATFVRSGKGDGTGRDLITIGASTPTTVITWAPYDKKGTGLLDFLPAGNVATFAGASGLTSYTVINRVLPSDATRPIAFNGTTLSQLTGMTGLATAGGTVVFFSPAGIVVGPTGVFNVGSLVLTTADPLALGNGFRLNSALNSTAGVTVQPGALITASAPGGFVDLVAPRIRQDGRVSVAGDALYVAGEQADVTANADGSTAIVLTRGARVGTDPLLLEHGGSTTGPSTAGGGATIVLAAAGQDAAAQVQVAGTLGYTGGGGRVTVVAGPPVGLPGIAAGTGLAAQTADLNIAGATFRSNLVAQAARNITVAAAANAATAGGATFAGTAALGFGGALAVNGAVTAQSLTATGGGTASTVTFSAPVTASVVTVATSGPVTLAAPLTAATSLTVNTPRLLTVTGAINPGSAVFNVGDIAIGATAAIGGAGTQEIQFLTDAGRASSATVGGAAGAGGFDLDASEFRRVQANRILVSTGFGATTRSLDLHIGDLTIRGSAATMRNLNPDTSLAPAVVLAASGGLYVDGQLAIAGAGATDTLGLLAGGRLALTLPRGGITLTSPTGALAGRLYLLGTDVVAASAPTQATVAAAADFTGRRNALGLNDGEVNDAGYIQAGTVDVRATNSFLNQNSGSRGIYGGISVGGGGLGFRQGAFAATQTQGSLTNLAAVDSAVRATTAPAEVIAFGRQVTSSSTITNAAFLPTVRVTATDVTLPSEINGCPIRGGGCRDPRGDGTALDRAGQLNDEIVRPNQDVITATNEATLVDAFIASQVVAFGPPRLIDLSAVTITAGIGDPATGAGDETMWDPLGLTSSDAGTPVGGSDGRVGKRPTVPTAAPPVGSKSVPR